MPPTQTDLTAAAGAVLFLGLLAGESALAPGGTTWTWRSCEDARCLSILYADSLNPVSADEYRISDDPEVVAAFERGIATVRDMPCDALLTVHPDFADLDNRRTRRLARVEDDDGGACRGSVERAESLGRPFGEACESAARSAAL